MLCCEEPATEDVEEDAEESPSPEYEIFRVPPVAFIFCTRRSPPAVKVASSVPEPRVRISQSSFSPVQVVGIPFGHLTRYISLLTTNGTRTGELRARIPADFEPHLPGSPPGPVVPRPRPTISPTGTTDTFLPVLYLCRVVLLDGCRRVFTLRGRSGLFFGIR